MDTDSVRLFVLAADKLNISAAGRELGIAPAVASARLAKLENALGADLLHRSTRKVSLSLEGAEFLPFAREILAQEAAAHAALGHGSATATGTLRFAAPSTFAQLYIAPLLPEFLELHPGIRLDLRLSDIPFNLIEGSFDLALRSSVIEDSSLKGRKLADDTRVLCASPAYLAKHGTPQDPQELSGHNLLAFRSRAPKQLVDGEGNTGVFDPGEAGGRLVVDDGCSHKIATLNGAGIAINSLWSVHENLKDGSLVQVLPGHTVDEPSVLWLVYPKSNVLTAKVRIFIDFLIEKIGKSPAWSQSQER
ncbi:LysR family transcriptional regulator [Roseibium polysiphoniae]|uniref:LysR family transcriptional regulator n=1 Tax=Roseibium polysiphoniae TaxID=2571221 RepID=UPI0032993F3F